jgi:hypothetical protein
MMSNVHVTIPIPMEEMADLSGIFLLICPSLADNRSLIDDFEMDTCRQIKTGTYPRVLNDLAYKVVATIATINGGLMSAIVEWGPNPQDLRKIGLLVGPIEEDWNEEILLDEWEVPQSWVHTHLILE